MKKSWLWDRNISDEEIKKTFSNIEDPQYIYLSALLLSRANSAQDVFKEYLQQKDFFLLWSRIKRQMRKNSWNDPRIEYWQAIFDTLKKKSELRELKQIVKIEEPLLSIYEEIGSRIRSAREQIGLTQKEFAKKMMISQQVISRVESGKQNISLKTLSKLCEQLGIPIDPNKFGFIEKPSATSTEHKLPFGNLSPDDFERLCYWVIDESKEFNRVMACGGVGDKGRDIVGYKNTIVGKQEKWYFQCKRYKKISFTNFQKELDGFAKYSANDKGYKPDRIVFITACPISPTCKGRVREYAEEKTLGPVDFWTDVKLDKKAKQTGADKEFFNKGINRSDLDKGLRSIEHKIKAVSDLIDESPIKNDEINKAINEAVRLMHSNEIEEAKASLFLILGKVEDNPMKYKGELARIYNNLGVCFNRLKEDGGNEVRAEKYFRQAIKVVPSFNKAKINLASLYLARGDEQNLKMAYGIIKPLWDASDKKDSLMFQVFIWSIFHYESPQKAFTYYENDKDIKPLVDQSEQLLNLLGTMYLGERDFDKADILAEKTCKLSPESSQNLLLKARILMARAQIKESVNYKFDLVPKFKNYEHLKEALSLLKKSLELVSAENNRFLENQIRADIYICSLWLWRTDDPEVKQIRQVIDDSKLIPEQKEQLIINDSIAALQRRDFNQSLKMLTESSLWSKLPYKEKFRIAYIFLIKGAPEEAKIIFKDLEDQAEKEKDVQFWLDMSLVEVLLNNKNLAINAAKKAREVSSNTNKEQMALSHFNALMLRYASSGEVDRLMEGMFDYDKKYPELKMIRPIKAITKDGKPTEEIKEILLKQKEWYERIRTSFRANPVPSYYLETLFKRPYIDILSRQNDPEFIIELTIPNEQFEKELLNNFNESENIVFDYASLLNLSKMNLLGYLEKFNKNLYIVEELFAKTQNELVRFEQDDLKNLWNFIRHSKSVKIIPKMEAQSTQNVISEMFGDWVIDSIELSKTENATFVVDDLRFLQFLKTEKIKCCNSFIILKTMRDRGWIDNKIYSLSIGDLAERFYTFIPFSGDDLFQISMEDKSKITLRSYHLVNQLFLSGSIVASFTNVFVRFIEQLWKTGSLPEDKVKWLEFFTNTILDFIEKQGSVNSAQEFEKVVPDFVKLWIISVQGSNRDEIILIEKMSEEILSKPYLAIIKDNIARFIKAKKDSLRLQY